MNQLHYMHSICMQHIKYITHITYICNICIFIYIFTDAYYLCRCIIIYKHYICIILNLMQIGEKQPAIFHFKNLLLTKYLKRNFKLKINYINITFVNSHILYLSSIQIKLDGSSNSIHLIQMIQNSFITLLFLYLLIHYLLTILNGPDISHTLWFLCCDKVTTLSNIVDKKSQISF